MSAYIWGAGSGSKNEALRVVWRDVLNYFDVQRQNNKMLVVWDRGGWGDMAQCHSPLYFTATS